NVICTIVFGRRFAYDDAEFLELLRLMNDAFREMSTPWAQVSISGSFREFSGIFGEFWEVLGEFLRIFYFGVGFGFFLLVSLILGRDLCFWQEKGVPGSEFTQENLELTTLNLFFAGTETVSSTLRFGLLFLMRHPHVEGESPGHPAQFPSQN
ncbi:CP2G1 protein, partial [Nesospiza acunhae]|nr:CP2G1 protein [Nesospiza acunhae]